MAEVTGQPPVEYQSVSQPAEGQATAWAENRSGANPNRMPAREWRKLWWLNSSAPSRWSPWG